jgi:type I restriction enzyme, S subunit
MNGNSELPESWVACQLGDVVNYGTTEKAEPSEIPAGSWVLELEDIEKDTSRILCRATFADRQSKSAKNRFRGGDVLYGKLRPYLNKVVHADVDGFCTTEIVPLRPSLALNSRYLFHWLRHPLFLDYVTAISHGLNMPRLGTEAGQRAPFILAPLGEQQRIADKLDAVLARVDNCRPRLDRVYALLAQFRQAVLEAATSGDLTADWRSARPAISRWQDFVLSEIADIQGGITKDSKKQILADEEVPYLRVANVQRGYIDLAEVKTIRVPAAKLTALLLRPGDVLFNEGGDIDKVGRGWIWEGQIVRCTFQNHVFRARLHDPDMQPKYVSWWGNSVGLNYFLHAGKQTTNLASINKTVLAKLPISLPPNDEQAEIVRRVESLFSLADTLESKLASARAQVERLTPALLAKAFRGELVPQDPNDEPASALLARVRQSAAAASTGRRRRAPAAAVTN